MITLANLGSPVPPCPITSCLVAVDVKPDDISFADPANSQTSKPARTASTRSWTPCEAPGGRRGWWF